MGKNSPHFYNCLGNKVKLAPEQFNCYHIGANIAYKMTFRQYIFSMFVGTLLSYISWAIVITSIDPLTAGFFGFTLFYLSAFTSLMGSLIIFSLLLRVYVIKRKLLLTKQVAISTRQAVLLAVVFVGALMLQSMKILNWWNTFFLVGGLTVIEFFIISLKRRV